MALFDDPSALLPGLLPAAWRGVPFWVVDTEHTIGRRIIATLYPGLDLKTHQDLGRLDGPVSLSGLVIGPDYVAQAKRLEAAFAQPGTGTLLHPWRGQIRAVLLRPARLSYAADELMVARIDAEFDPEMRPRNVIGLASSLAGLMGAAGEMMAAARALALDVLAQPLATVGLVREMRETAGSVVTLAGASVSGGPFAAGATPDMARAIDALALADAATAAVAPGHLATAIETAVLAIRKAAMPLPEPAIGPAGARPPARDPRTGAAAMAVLASRLAAMSTPAGTVPLALAAEMMAVAGLAELTGAIRFESRQDAQSWRQRLDAALSAHGQRIATMGAAMPGRAAGPWRTTLAMRAAVARDMNEAVGRLPAVLSIEARPGMSAWQIAQHVAGDDPARVTTVYRDIWRRNRLRHPGQLPSGMVEVLP